MPTEQPVPDVTEEIASRLTEVRTKRGLTREDVEKATGVPARTLRGWERGNVKQPAWMIPRLARFYRVSCDYLLAADDSFFALIDPKVEREALATHDPERFRELLMRLSVFVTDRLETIRSSKEWLDRLSELEKHAESIQGAGDESGPSTE